MRVCRAQRGDAVAGPSGPHNPRGGAARLFFGVVAGTSQDQRLDTLGVTFGAAAGWWPANNPGKIAGVDGNRKCPMLVLRVTNHGGH